MIFCPTCGNMLIVRENYSVQRVFACQTCPYQHKIENKISRVIPLEKKQVDDVLGDEIWETAQKTNIRCIACENDTAYFMQIQTRSADEPSTVFYRCTKCAKKWNEN